MQSFEIFYRIRKAKSISFLSDIFHKSEETVKKWCLNADGYNATGARNPLDCIKDMVDELRSDGEHSLVSDIQDHLFPCGRLTVCGDPMQVFLEFTTVSQGTFVDLMKAYEDKQFTEDEKKVIRDHIGEIMKSLGEIEEVLG